MEKARKKVVAMTGTTEAVGVSMGGEGVGNDSGFSSQGGFCEGKFWDLSLTWETEDPDFTACFHQTVTDF